MSASADKLAALTPLQYQVTQESHTETPFTGAYWDHWDAGDYHCICCGVALFQSADKFDAGCGWPSFSQTPHPQHIDERLDNSHSMRRIEVVCNQCNAHLGHVFEDGPAPGGRRYCINSASLNFQKTDERSEP